MNDLLAQVRKFRSLELNPHYQRLFDAVIEELEVRASVQPPVVTDDDEHRPDCVVCDGSGKSGWDHPCPRCGGSGKKPADKSPAAPNG